MQKKLDMEFVAYVDKSLNVNDYTNPFTDEKYRESLTQLINDTREGAIVVMDGEYFEMMERSNFKVPSIVLFDYEHEDIEDTKFIHSYGQLCDFLSCRNEKVFVIGGFDAWSSLVQYVSKVHFLVTDEKWGDGMTRPFLFDVREMCRITSCSELTNGITHQEREFCEDVVICNGDIDKDIEDDGDGVCCGYELFCYDIISHINFEGEPVNRILSNGLSTLIEKGDKLKIVTDFKIYKTPPNIKINVTQSHNLNVLGVVIESCEIVNGSITITLVSKLSHHTVLDYKKVVAVVYATGNYKLLRCNNDFSESMEMGKWGTELVKH
jgi:hypothetical protein